MYILWSIFYFPRVHLDIFGIKVLFLKIAWKFKINKFYLIAITKFVLGKISRLCFCTNNNNNNKLGLLASGRHSHRNVTQPFINLRVSDNYVLINQANCPGIIFSGRVWWISSCVPKIFFLLTNCHCNCVVLIIQLFWKFYDVFNLYIITIGTCENHDIKYIIGRNHYWLFIIVC